MERGTLVNDFILRALTRILFCLFVTLPVWSLAHEGGSPIDTSLVPLEGKSVNDFVPPGWALEEQMSGDLNKDSLVDVALKLIEDKPVKDTENPENRRRVLVILFKSKDGKLSRVAVTDKLLQCTRCGGAFYGIMDAPANVRIEKGALIVSQDHGSRNVIESTFRFRYDITAKRFVLIGLDINDRDRLTGVSVAKSSNFLTGVQIIKRLRVSERKGGDVTESTVKKRVPRQKVFIEQVDYEKY
jgi:hypothetical protein